MQSKKLFQIEMHATSELGKVPTSLLRRWANTGASSDLRHAANAGASLREWASNSFRFSRLHLWTQKFHPLQSKAELVFE